MPLEEVESIEKPVKAKKPATDYQLANMKKGHELRLKKLEDKELGRIALQVAAETKAKVEGDRIYNEKVAAGVAKGLAEAKPKPKKKQVIVYESDDDGIEAPIIIKRKKPQPVVTSEENYEPPTPPPPQAPRRLKRV